MSNLTQTSTTYRILSTKLPKLTLTKVFRIRSAQK